MTGEVIAQVENVIHELEEQQSTQNTINNAYSAFQELVQGEMIDKISHKIIYHQSHTHQKKQRQHKPWWSTDLSALWSELCQAEKAWVEAPIHHKAQLKAAMKQVQRHFNHEVQKAK